LVLSQIINITKYKLYIEAIAIAIAIAQAKARAFALNINYNILVDPVLSNTAIKDSIAEPKQLKDLVSPENLMSKFFGNDENEAVDASGAQMVSFVKVPD